MSAKQRNNSTVGKPPARQRAATERGTGKANTRRSKNGPSPAAQAAGPVLPAVSTMDAEKLKIRGRPRAFAASHMARIEDIYGDCMSPRQLMNKAYMARAIRVLGFRREFAWLGLASREAMEGKEHILRETVLAELGRVRDPMIMKLLAAHVCRTKPATSKLCVKVIRGRRLTPEGEELASGETEELCNELLALVKVFKDKRPGFSSADAKAALCWASHYC